LIFDFTTQDEEYMLTGLFGRTSLIPVPARNSFSETMQSFVRSLQIQPACYSALRGAEKLGNIIAAAATLCA
jgi:hypothetical protein